jgi:hypothetical protein
VTRARPSRCTPADLGSAETTNRRESLCLNAYLMNHWSRSSIRVWLAGVASTVGCRAEMTMSSRWRPSVTEWPQAWRITRLTTYPPRQTLRHQEFPKQSIWRSEGCWATPQSTPRTADSAVCGFDGCDGSRQTIGIVAARPGRRTTLWIADATEVDYDLFRGPARSWQVEVSATTSFRSSPEIVPSVVDGQHWMLEAVSGSTL